MPIPPIFYFRFWLTGSLMAIATGLVVGYFMPGAFLSVPLLGSVMAAILALLVQQCFVFSHFWGKRRGAFEYEYRQYLLKKRTKGVFIGVLGRAGFYKWHLDQFSEMPWYEGEMCQKVLMKLHNQANDDLKFPVYVQAAKIAARGRKYNKALEYLKQALAVSPDDLVANLRQAEVFEYMGLASEAISSYKSAIEGPASMSVALRRFVSSHVERVRAKGPRKKPPITGFRRITW
jgi:hypothetical protein